jgi:hypothetical protein
MARRGWTAVAVVGVLLAVTAPVGWALDRPPGTVDAEAAGALAQAIPAATASTRSAGGDAVGGSAVPVQDGRIGTASESPAPVPVRLRLPRVEVTAAIRPVGVDPEGDLEIPGDVAAVGWYRFGPRPGDPAGSTVLSGHVDSAEQGRGAFFPLRRLAPGDPVLVQGSDGRIWSYRVVAREEWPKTDVPLDRIFSRTGAPRLTLVTCGGGFREDIRSYQDNIAVTAVPDGQP